MERERAMALLRALVAVTLVGEDGANFNNQCLLLAIDAAWPGLALEWKLAHGGEDKYRQDFGRFLVAWGQALLPEEKK